MEKNQLTKFKEHVQAMIDLNDARLKETSERWFKLDGKGNPRPKEISLEEMDEEDTYLLAYNLCQDFIDEETATAEDEALWNSHFKLPWELIRLYADLGWNKEASKY